MRKKKAEWEPPRLTTDLLERIVKRWTWGDVHDNVKVYEDIIEAIICEALPEHDLTAAGALLASWMRHRREELAQECEGSEQEEAEW